MKTPIRSLTLILSFFIVPILSAQITVTGNITENTIWTIADSPVFIENTITITVGNTLTINEGVVVEMGSNASLLVEGALVANGTLTDKITFTSAAITPSPGDWGSIEFRNNASAGSVFNHVLVEYGAGADRNGMVFYTTGAFSVDISNSEFRFSAFHGINLRASSPDVFNSLFTDNSGFGVYTDLSLNFTVSESEIRDNAGGGIRVPINSEATISDNIIENQPVGILIDNGGRPTITNNQILTNTVGIRIIEVGATQPQIRDNTITGNIAFGAENLGNNTLDARFNYWGSSLGPTVDSNPTGSGDTVTDNINYTPWRYGAANLPVVEVNANILENETWVEGNVYLLTTNITVDIAATLIIEPGVIVKLGSAVSLNVNGVLTSNGTADKLIIFTSSRDDAAGGDSNLDGDATVPARDDWGRININNPGSSMAHTLIRYGGSTTTTGVLQLTAPILLSHVTVANNFRNGIYSNADQSQWDNVRSIDNSIHGIYMNQTSLSMTNGETSLNGSVGLYLNSAGSEKAIRLYDFIANSNISHGIFISAATNRQGTRIDTLMNSVISSNGSTGLLLQYSDTGQQYFSSNTIADNSGHGISLHHGMNSGDVIFTDNIIQGNGQAGIRSNRATFINNQFNSNRFGLGIWYNLGHIYTDGFGVDSNTFTGSTYPGAIALYAESLQDTLSATVPASYANATYILASTGVANSSTHTLLIEPGVTIKTSAELVSVFTNFRLDGVLIANGTADDPIVFTSLYDHDYGGDVSRIDDSTTPSRGDWAGLNLFHAVTSASELKHVYVRYGRQNLQLGQTSTGAATIDYVNTLEDIWIDNALFEGMLIYEAAVTFERLRVTNNARSGVLLQDRNNNSFITRAIIRNSEIMDNGGTNTNYAGLQSVSNQNSSAFTEISNTTISGNSIGLNVENAVVPMSLVGNIIENNVSHGVRVTSNLLAVDIAYIGNIIRDNGQTGILSSKARFIDNEFTGNRFGLGVWKNLGHIYTDGSGVDGNSFTGNTYPGAIALYAESLQDTLSATVPASYANATYILASTGVANSSTHTLLIEPGVTIKTSSELVSVFTNFRLDGVLIANGTELNPIVFTSLYDHDYGGDVSRIDDSTTPSRGDWAGLNLYHAATSSSVLNHVYVRYGRQNLQLGQTSTAAATIVYENTLEDIWIDNALFEGLVIYEAAATFERLRVTNSARSGVYLQDRNNNSFITRAIIRNSEIIDNGGTNTSYAGLHALTNQNSSTFTEISNTTISGNSVGVSIGASPLPVSIQSNIISNNNTGSGIYARLVAVENDTALTVVGNTITGHTSASGAIVTRAIISDNIFENNAFPVSLMGELSLEGSVNENGTIFENNTIGDHLYKDAIGLYSTSTIGLKGKLGFSWPASYVNSAYIPVSATTYINTTDSVSVAPGTVFKMGHTNSNQQIQVTGHIEALGEIDNKIVFTSIKDDSFAGDTNLDENTTLPAKSDWNRIYMLNTTTDNSVFKHVISRYAHYNFYFNNSSAMVDSSFSSNAEYGVYSTNSSNPTIRNSDIHSNRWGILVSSSSEDPNIHLNNIYNNSDAGLHISRNVTAIDNYWGDLTGPFVDQGIDLNLDGQGDRIFINGSSEAIYRPFLTDRTGVLLGDVSEDGSISAFDASLILQHIVELITLTPTQLAAADVSGDGTVSALDGSFILQYVVGIISGFPGAGKVPEFKPEDIYELQTTITDTYLDMKFISKGTLALLAGNLALKYPEGSISSVENIPASITANWTKVQNNSDSVYKVAMAGVQPMSEEGEIIHLRFHLKENSSVSLEEFEIVSFKLNEIDLTESAGDVFTSIDEPQPIPDKFSLDQNFPNPFNPSTNIRYLLPVNGEVTLRIFNSIGQEVAVLMNNQVHNAGIYLASWNAMNVSSGVYFYRIEVRLSDGNMYTDVKRMTLIK